MAFLANTGSVVAGNNLTGGASVGESGISSLKTEYARKVFLRNKTDVHR